MKVAAIASVSAADFPRAVKVTVDEKVADTPGISVFSLGLYVEFHTKGIFDMESEI